MKGTYFLPIHQWHRALNAGRWQAFPGLWLYDSATGAGIVTGVLSQDVWKHTLAKESVHATEVSLKGKMTPPGLNFKTYAPGESYKGEELFFEIVRTRNPGTAFLGYLSALEERIQPRFPESTLRKGPFWGSWNDRQPHFWDVDMPLIRRTIETLKARIPSVRSVQIDDGYAFGGYHEITADRWALIEEGLDPSEVGRKIKRVRRLGSGFAGEPDYAIARDRFPDGMEAAAELIKGAGYQPAIWMGLDIVRDATVIKEHPEWFTACTARSGADPELLTVFGEDAENRTYVLDPSIPEVQAYIERTLAILLRDWGFESLKLDFWSYVFENDGFRLKETDKTAFELRRWFFDTVRRYLPKESYLVIACDISTGNPFLGRWVDAVRYGLDIGNGKWENFRYSSMTATFLLHVGARRFYQLDPDSMGLLRALPKSERQCFWAWSAVTRSLCEIAGDLALASRKELSDLQKLFLAPKNGAEVRLGETEHLRRAEPASIVFAPGDLFSHSAADKKGLPAGVLAVFNWSEDTRLIDVALKDLGLATATDYWDTDFFSGEAPVRRSGRWTVSIPPRAVRLSHLSAIDECPMVLDSNWAILDIRATHGALDMILHGDASGGLTIAWSHGRQLDIKHSSIPAKTTKLTQGIYKITPTLSEDRLERWKLELRSLKH